MSEVAPTANGEKKFFTHCTQTSKKKNEPPKTHTTGHETKMGKIPNPIGQQPTSPIPSRPNPHATQTTRKRDRHNHARNTFFIPGMYNKKHKRRVLLPLQQTRGYDRGCSSFVQSSVYLIYLAHLLGSGTEEGKLNRRCLSPEGRNVLVQDALQLSLLAVLHASDPVQAKGRQGEVKPFTHTFPRRRDRLITLSKLSRVHPAAARTVQAVNDDGNGGPNRLNNWMLVA